MEEKINETKTEENVETKKDEHKKEEKKKKEIPKVKREFVIVNVQNSPVSTKESMAICKFIKFKKIDDAVADLEQVVALRKAVPMKGEIPHRHGAMMSGRFPRNASLEFIKLLKSLKGNANTNLIEEPVIVEAVPNIGQRPFGRFGRFRRKRTHIFIKAIEQTKLKENNKNKSKKEKRK
jgi:large subunit ribosomal protein L22